MILKSYLLAQTSWAHICPLIRRYSRLLVQEEAKGIVLKPFQCIRELEILFSQGCTKATENQQLGKSLSLAYFLSTTVEYDKPYYFHMMYKNGQSLKCYWRSSAPTSLRYFIYFSQKMAEKYQKLQFPLLVLTFRCCFQSVFQILLICWAVRRMWTEQLHYLFQQNYC